MKRVALILAGAAALIAGCSSGGSSAPPPGTTTASGTTPPSTSATPKPPALPVVCQDLLPLIDLDAALGVPLVGQTVLIKGVAEPKIKRTGRVTCRFGVPPKGGAPKLEVGISGYTDETAAKDRVEATVVSLRTAGNKPSPTKVGGLDATLLSGAGPSTLVLSTGPRTIVISLADRVVPIANRAKALVAVGELAVKNLPEQ